LLKSTPVFSIILFTLVSKEKGKRKKEKGKRKKEKGKRIKLKTK